MNISEIKRSYLRNINQNYLVLNYCNYFGNSDNTGIDYRIQMLKKNKIQGLLVMSKRVVNNEESYYYDINSLVPFSQIYEKRQIKYCELEKILSSCVNTINQLGEFLLDGNQIIFDPEYIYIDTNDYSARLVYFPDYEGNIKQGFTQLMDFIISRLDHSDDQAVNLGYKMYRYTRQTNYVITDMRNMITEISQCSQYNNQSIVESQVNACHPEIPMPNQGQNQYSNQYQCCNENNVAVQNNSYDNMQNEVYVESKVVESGNKKKTPLLIVGLLAFAVILGIVKICNGNVNDSYAVYIFALTFVSFVSAIIIMYSYLKKS